ncbi:hypothetical protein ACFLSA_04400 [Bacteroidota bacterium]
MKNKIFLLVISVLVIAFVSKTYVFGEKKNQEHNKEQVESVTEHDKSHESATTNPKQHDNHEEAVHEEGEAHEGHHGGMEPLFFVIVALVIGAATRFFFQKKLFTLYGIIAYYWYWTGFYITTRIA